jgi:hypothetical protein
VRSAIDRYLDEGVGVVQMPCPEQRTWGGVLKGRFLWLLDHRGLARAPKAVASAAQLYLRIRYRRLARAVAHDVADYIDCGFEVAGVIGVAGSPSCGAGTTLDLEDAVRTLGSCPYRPLTTEWLNEGVIRAAYRPGSGLFLQALGAALMRRHITVPTAEVATDSGALDTRSHRSEPTDREARRQERGTVDPSAVGSGTRSRTAP